MSKSQASSKPSSSIILALLNPNMGNTFCPNLLSAFHCSHCPLPVGHFTNPRYLIIAFVYKIFHQCSSRGTNCLSFHIKEVQVFFQRFSSWYEHIAMCLNSWTLDVCYRRKRIAYDNDKYIWQWLYFKPRICYYLS